MKRRHCFECAHVRPTGAGVDRTDGDEDFSLICDVTGRTAEPSARACDAFTPVTGHAKKETPHTTKRGANQGKAKYIIKSPVVRRICAGLDSWKFRPRNEDEELLLARALDQMRNVAVEYARTTARRAVNRIGRS